MDSTMRMYEIFDKIFDKNISLSTKIEKAIRMLRRKTKYKKNYSQCGEDIIAKFIIDNGLKNDKITYIDIGANKPIEGNNTYLLYKNGIRGINVEPNILLWQKKKYRKTT